MTQRKGYRMEGGRYEHNLTLRSCLSNNQQVPQQFPKAKHIFEMNWYWQWKLRAPHFGLHIISRTWRTWSEKKLIILFFLRSILSQIPPTFQLSKTKCSRILFLTKGPRLDTHACMCLIRTILPLERIACLLA